MSCVEFNPESLPPEEDIKKLERRLKSQEKEGKRKGWKKGKLEE